jgi:hypothetical protein
MVFTYGGGGVAPKDFLCLSIAVSIPSPFLLTPFILLILLNYHRFHIEFSRFHCDFFNVLKLLTNPPRISMEDVLRLHGRTLLPV